MTGRTTSLLPSAQTRQRSCSCSVPASAQRLRQGARAAAAGTRRPVGTAAAFTGNAAEDAAPRPAQRPRRARPVQARTLAHQDGCNDQAVDAQDTRHNDWHDVLHDFRRVHDAHGRDAHAGLGRPVRGTQVCSGEAQCSGAEMRVRDGLRACLGAAAAAAVPLACSAAASGDRPRRRRGHDRAAVAEGGAWQSATTASTGTEHSLAKTRAAGGRVPGRQAGGRRVAAQDCGKAAAVPFAHRTWRPTLPAGKPDRPPLPARVSQC